MKFETSIWCIDINNEDWLQSKCNCPFFLKNYYCKHMIGVANILRLDGCSIPLNAKIVPLGQKRKRGAPKKATRALLTL